MIALLLNTIVEETSGAIHLNGHNIIPVNDFTPENVLKVDQWLIFSNLVSDSILAGIEEALASRSIIESILLSDAESRNRHGRNVLEWNNDMLFLYYF